MEGNPVALSNPPATRRNQTGGDSDELPVMLNVEEAGELLGLSRSAAYRAARRQELPVITLSGRQYVPTAPLLEMLGLPPAVVAERAAALARRITTRRGDADGRR